KAARRTAALPTGHSASPQSSRRTARQSSRTQLALKANAAEHLGRVTTHNTKQELLMKITTIGRGTIGGTLGRLWRSAGHEVTELGKGGGDAADADVVLLAVPGEAVPNALAGVTGLHGKVVLDATNRVGVVEHSAPAGYRSIAEYVKAQTGGPTAKAFNLNFGKLLDQ